MARPRETIQYKLIPPGLVLTFVGSVDQRHTQPYIVVTATPGPLVAINLLGAYLARRRARRAGQQNAASTGNRFWVCWFNRKILSWYYEFTTVPIL